MSDESLIDDPGCREPSLRKLMWWAGSVPRLIVTRLGAWMDLLFSLPAPPAEINLP